MDGQRRTLLPGIFLFIFGSFFMSIQAMAIHAIGNELSTGMIMVARFILPLLANLSLAFLSQRVRKELHFKNLKLLILRSLSAAFAMTIVFFAIPGNNAGIVYILFFSQPLIMPFILALWLKIPVEKKLYIGFVLSLVGIALVLKPGNEGVSWTLFIVPLATLLASFSAVALRQLHYTDTTFAITTTYCAVGTSIGLILALLDPSLSFATWSPKVAGAFFVIGLTGFIFQWLITDGMRYGPSRLLSPFLYASSLFSLLFDYLFFGQIVTGYNLLGVLLVIVGVVINIYLFPKHEITKIPSEKN